MDIAIEDLTFLNYKNILLKDFTEIDFFINNNKDLLKNDSLSEAQVKHLLKYVNSYKEIDPSYPYKSSLILEKYTQLKKIRGLEKKQQQEENITRQMQPALKRYNKIKEVTERMSKLEEEYRIWSKRQEREIKAKETLLKEQGEEAKIKDMLELENLRQKNMLEDKEWLHKIEKLKRERDSIKWDK